jgi:hypothetical protein
MNETPTPVKQRKTRYDLNFKRSTVELWQSRSKSAAAMWPADSPYIETDEGWLYVAGIRDHCPRRCVD